jgi:hypothetical protein
MHDFGGENYRERDHFVKLSVNESIVLESVFMV